MNATELINRIYEFKPKSLKELRSFYEVCCSDFDQLSAKDKKRVRDSMLMEMLERAVK